MLLWQSRERIAMLRAGRRAGESIGGEDVDGLIQLRSRMSATIRLRSPRPFLRRSMSCPGSRATTLSVLTRCCHTLPVWKDSNRDSTLRTSKELFSTDTTLSREVSEAAELWSPLPNQMPQRRVQTVLSNHRYLLSMRENDLKVSLPPRNGRTTNVPSSLSSDPQLRPS